MQFDTLVPFTRYGVAYILGTRAGESAVILASREFPVLGRRQMITKCEMLQFFFLGGGHAAQLVGT